MPCHCVDVTRKVPSALQVQGPKVFDGGGKILALVSQEVGKDSFIHIAQLSVEVNKPTPTNRDGTVSPSLRLNALEDCYERCKAAQRSVQQRIIACNTQSQKYLGCHALLRKMIGLRYLASMYMATQQDCRGYSPPS